MGPTDAAKRAERGGRTLRRVWIGLALLSVSWLFGLSYYHDANWVAWAALVVIGTGLMVGFDLPRPTRGELAIAALLTVPAIVLAPWPCRAAGLLVFAGALLSAAPIPRRWPARLGIAGITAGVILIVQALGMLTYESITARSHELPRFAAYLLYATTRLLGIDAALDGTTIALHSMREVHELGATWELLLDPPTWCFLLGGVTLVSLSAVRARSGERPAGLLKSLAALSASMAIWLLARAAILIAAFMHRALRTEYDATLILMNQFWSPWVHLAMLLGPVLLAARFVRISSTAPIDDVPSPGVGLRKRIALIALACTGVLLITVGLLWDPPGRRKQGRVLVDEYHSTWEPTERPYDTEWYGQESGYNYACIYDYGSRFYEMGRLNAPIDANALGQCDVLVVKVPTSRYGREEIATIEQFVQNGGGLLLIGEHTNVFNTGTHLNDIASVFGFRFRYDCLFDIDTTFTQLYRPPPAPHPIVQNIPPMDFAVSCSIHPGRRAGRAVIRATGLRSLPADYHASNFYPQVEDRAESRCGAFIQLWTTRRGAGRVAAFTDSTIFSNFSTFEPGKAELMLGMLEWLNHRNASWDMRPPLIGLGVLLAAGALVFRKKWAGSRLVLFGAVMMGWPLGVMSVQAMHRAAMPPPPPVRPFTQVVIDRTVCDTPLSRSGFIGGEENGFGIFERWVLRLGYFTSRRQGPDAFSAELLVLLYPSRAAGREFCEALTGYVASGGKVLLLDAPANAESTANELLYSFGLSVEHATQTRGALSVPEGWPAVAVDSACEVKGGTALIRIGETPVAATARLGDGTVTVLGFGSRFADTQMGVTGDVIPDAPLRNVYELQFSLLRSILSTPDQAERQTESLP